MPSGKIRETLDYIIDIFMNKLDYIIDIFLYKIDYIIDIFIKFFIIRLHRYLDDQSRSHAKELRIN